MNFLAQLFVDTSIYSQWVVEKHKLYTNNTGYPITYIGSLITCIIRSLKSSFLNPS